MTRLPGLRKAGAPERMHRSALTDWDSISAACGIALDGDTAAVQSGGSISTACRVESADGPVFVKLEQPGLSDRLEAERDGLAALSDAGAVRVPRVLACGVTAGTAAKSFLVLEWIEAARQPAAAAVLGEQLAALHRCTSDRFGWHRDNYIGATPQPNTQSNSWSTFLRDQRLGFQLQLARRRGFHFSEAHAQRLLDGLPEFYRDYAPAPSLLHGDLWGGNWFSDAGGRPVIFDPAVYYGDREADLAMTELFGGFGADFYAAYAEAWPLDPGYAVRRDLHQLYHLLNHLNLFGGGYREQAARLLEKLCAEVAG